MSEDHSKEYDRIDCYVYQMS